MRPSDLYAMPTLSEDDWTTSHAVAVMFGEELAYPKRATVTDVPLRILTKVQVEDLDDPDGDDTFWQVVTWEGRPFGVVQRTGEWSGTMVVTDAALHQRALLALMALRSPEMAEAVTDPDRDVPDLDHGGGHVLVDVGGRIRAVPRRICANRTPLLDLDGIKAEEMLTSVRTSVLMQSWGPVRLREMVFGHVAPGLRRTADYDVPAMVTRLPSLRNGWLGPLVATDDATYLLCAGGTTVDQPVVHALGIVRVGPPSAIDELCTGTVIEPDVAMPCP